MSIESTDARWPRRLWRADGVRSRLLMPFALLMALVCVAFLVSYYQGRERERTLDLASTTLPAVPLLQSIVRRDTAMMAGILRALAADTTAKEVFLTGDRAALLAYLGPLFRQLKDEVGITQLLFHTPDHHVFLRLHEPERFGDTVERATLAAAEAGGLGHGIELGPLGTPVLRVVLPWRDGERPIGFLEAGVGIDRILAHLQEILGGALVAAVRKEAVDRAPASADRDRFEEVVVVAKTLPGWPAYLADMLGRYRHRGDGAAQHRAGDGTLLSHVSVPLVDAEGRDVGDLLVIQDATEIHAAFVDSVRSSVALLLASGGGVFALFFLFLGRVDIDVRRAREALARAVAERTRELTAEIERRKRAQDALAETERRFRNLVEGSIQGIIVHRNHRPLFVNQAFADMLGYETPDEVVRVGSMDAFVHPDDRSLARAQRRARLGGETVPEIAHYRGLCKNGAVLWLEARSTVVDWGGKPAIQATVFDITERKWAEETLRENERRFKDFAEASSDWFWETDDELRFTRFVGRLQVDPSTYMGKTRRDFVDPDSDPEKWRRHFEDLEARRPFRNLTYPLLRADGKKLWIRVSGIPVYDDAGQFLGYRGSGSDVTPEMEAEQRAAQAHARLVDAIESVLEGFALFDPDDRLVLCNERYRDFAPPAIRALVKPGAHFEDLVRAAVASGYTRYSDGSAEKQIQERLAYHRNPVGHIEVLRSDGRWLLITECRTQDGGFALVQTEISEMKLREAALRDAERQAAAARAELLDAIESISEGFALYDSDDRLVLCNERYRDFAPPATRALMRPGVEFGELVRTGLEVGCLKYSEDAAQVQLRRRMERHRDPRGSIELLAGGDRWLMVTEHRMQEGGIAVVQIDITEMKRREIELSASEERFRTLIEGSIQGVLVHRYDRLLFANQALADILGYRAPDGVLRLGCADAFIAPSDRERARANAEARLRGEAAPQDYELEGLRKDGSVIWLNARSVLIDWEGRPAILTTLFDVNERKAAEQALGESERRFRNLVEGSIQGIVVYRDGKPLFANQALADILGYEGPDDFLRMDSVDEFVHADEIERIRAMREARVRGERVPRLLEFRAVRKDGSSLWLESRPTVVEWNGERAIQGTFFDITDRKKAEQALRESEARYRTLLERSIQGIMIRQDETIVFANQAYADILGYDNLQELLALDSVERIEAPHEITRLRAYIEARRSGREAPACYEFEGLRKDGSTVWLENRIQQVTWKDRPAFLAMVTDITERKAAEQALRESEERLNAFFTHAPAGLALYDSEWRYTKINRTLAEVNGLAIETHLGRKPSDCLPPELAAIVECELREVLESGVALENIEVSAEHPSRPGVRGHWVVSRFPVPLAGNAAAAGSVVVDITAQKEAEEAVRRARDELELKVAERTRELAAEKQSFQRYISLANMLFVAIDREGTITLVNRKVSEVLGYREDELIGRNWFDLMVPEEEREQRRAFYIGLLAGDGKAWSKGERRENYVVTKHRERRLLSWRNSLVRDDDGRIVVTLGAGEDITDERRTEIELRQTHRFAALAGGLSGSLNKLLQPVGTLTEMVLLDLPENSPNRESLTKVLEASHRAAEMVRRILTFDRRDEPRRVACDIYRVVADTLALVRPSVPSAVSLDERLDARTGAVLADPAETEAVVMTLVTNAAAAIGGRSGRIAVALAPARVDAGAVPGLEPGRYARITVTDDGPERDRETVERFFDPFIAGKGGEGPGLSIAHGIVTRHGGILRGESGPQGSRFEVYLRLVEATFH